MESMETGVQQAATAGDGGMATVTQQPAQQQAAAQSVTPVQAAQVEQNPAVQTTVASVGQMAPPAQAPAPLYPQYLAQQPPPSPLTEAISAGAMGLVIVGSGAMGANLHRVNDGEMSMGEALGDSLGKGAVGATAAAGATYAATTLTTGGLFGLAVTIAAGTGISYLLNK